MAKLLKRCRVDAVVGWLADAVYAVSTVLMLRMSCSTDAVDELQY